MRKTKLWKMPEVGSAFEKIYNGRVYRLKVVKILTGVAFELDGHLYDTPTAAAKYIVKHEVNGWTFWKMNKKAKKLGVV